MKLAKLAVLPLFAIGSPAALASGQCESQKLAPDDLGPGAELAYDVDTSGGIAVVGAPHDFDPTDPDPGVAYVYRYEPLSSAWVQAAELVSSDGSMGDSFGWSVGIAGDGDGVLVAAYRDDDLGESSGSVYVFERAGPSWVQTSKLHAPDGEAFDFFGSAVAARGDLAVIGTTQDDDLGTDAGAAHVFRRSSGGSWSHVAKLLPSDGGATDHFGAAVAIGDDVLMIGSPRSEGTAGAVYVFEHGAGGWTETSKLVASDGSSGDVFGTHLSISGDRAVFSAYRDDDLGSSSGSAYVFERSIPGDWLEVAKLLPSDGAAGDWFASRVAVSGTRVLVGAMQHDAAAVDAGAAYVFEGAGSTWQQVEKLVPSDADAGDLFGLGVVFSEQGHALIGARFDEEVAPQAGSVYVFDVLGDDPLRACPPKLSVSSGGSQHFTITAGSEHALKLYFLAGTLSGTAPGFPLGGVTVPLNVDDFLFQTVNNPNLAPYADTFGVLSASGTATASLTLPPGTSPSLVGLELHHAYVVWDLFGGHGAELASNATSLTLLP